MMNQKGITLLEALTVFALIGIILAISVPLSLKLIRRYRVESQTRTVYSTWMEARQRAMQRNVAYLIKFDETSMLVYEDKNRDGVADANEIVNELSQRAFAFRLRGQVGAQDMPPTRTVTASDKGLVQPEAYINVWDNSANRLADETTFNCIRTNVTRIGLGKNATGTVTDCQVQ